MVKLIAGKKGSGKTKNLIEAIHTAEKESKGNVVAIQYGSSLNIDIYHKIRLINIEDYKVIESDSGLWYIVIRMELLTSLTLYASKYEMDEEEVYEITGTTESNVMENKISNESPVGAALLKHKLGDVVTVSAPDGAYKLRIDKID